MSPAAPRTGWVKYARSYPAPTSLESSLVTSCPQIDHRTYMEQLMLKRWAFLISVLFLGASGAAGEPGQAPHFQSAFLRAELAPNQPAFALLTVDSLGEKKLFKNPLRPPAAPGKSYELRRAGKWFEYRVAGQPGSAPVWSFAFSERQIELRSNYSAGNPPPPILLDINPHVSRGTLLGFFNDDGTIRLPAILHLPNLGTFRITAIEGKGLALGYDALRHKDKKVRVNDFVKVTIFGASAANPQVAYTMDVVDIYPSVPNIAHDPRFDGFRRDWLDMFQLAPRFRALANHAASDVVPFTLFEYSAMAVHTPPLAPGLTALGLVRATLDRYLGGMKGYGQAGYIPNDATAPYDFSDTYPSLLMAASDYVQGSKDDCG